MNARQRMFVTLIAIDAIALGWLAYSLLTWNA